MNKPPKIVVPNSSSESSTSITTVPDSLSNTSSEPTSDQSVPPVDPAVRIKDEQERIRKAILALRTQVRNPVIMDGFLCCLSPQTSIDGRMPFTPKRAITTQDRAMLLHNLVGHAILAWGVLARGEPNISKDANPWLAELEQIVRIGFKDYGAYPKERNSAIYVLRTVADERKLYADRSAAQEKALEMKANIRAGGLVDEEKPDED